MSVLGSNPSTSNAWNALFDRTRGRVVRAAEALRHDRHDLQRERGMLLHEKREVALVDAYDPGLAARLRSCRTRRVVDAKRLTVRLPDGIPYATPARCVQTPDLASMDVTGCTSRWSALGGAQ